MSDSHHADDADQPDETQSSEEVSSTEQSVDPLPLDELAQVHHRMGIAGTRLNDAHSHLAEAYAWREHETPVTDLSDAPREELLAALSDASAALDEAIQRLETSQDGEDGDDQAQPDDGDEPSDEMAWNRDE